MNNSIQLSNCISLFVIAFLLTGCGSLQNQNTASNTHTETSLSAKDHEEYARAIQLIQQQSHKEASKKLQKITDRNPGYTDAWANLAISHYLNEEYEQAKKSIETALSLNNQTAELLNLAGLISVETGDYKVAEAYYKDALAKDPNLSKGYFNLALLQDIYFQDIKSAILNYDAYLKLIDKQDMETKEWVDELKRRLPRQ